MAPVVDPGIRSIAQMGVRTKALVMAGTLLGLFTSAMDQTVVSTSLPRIVADLGGLGLFPWVFTAFMVTSTTTVPIVGKLTDIYGRKPFYMAGIAILLLGSALAGSSQNMEQLIAFRAVQGLGAGMIMGIAFAIVGDVFTPAERGKWAGLLSGVFASASVIGPLIGGSLTDHVHWRWVFYVNLPLGSVALLVLMVGMPVIRPVTRPRLDYRGALLLMATVVPMLLAFSWAGSRYDWLSPQILGILSWTAVALAVFTYAELRADEPLFPMSLFRNRIFTVSAIVTLLTGIGMFSSFSFIPLFVQGVVGSSATNSGLVTMPMMIAMALSSAIAGQIMSRFGHYRLLGVAGLLVMASGVYLLSQLNVQSTNVDATRAMVVVGIGLGTSMPLFMLAVQNAVAFRYMGIATSTIQFLRSVGGTMGVAVIGSLITSSLSRNLAANTPSQVRENVPPQVLKPLEDPQILLSPQQLQAVKAAFAQLGPQGGQLFDLAIGAVKLSLATAIADAFIVAVLVTAGAVVAGVFLKEIPLRRVHYFEEGEPAFAQPAAANDDALALAEPSPSRYPGFGLRLLAVGLMAVATLFLLALAVRRNGRQPQPP